MGGKLSHMIVFGIVTELASSCPILMKFSYSFFCVEKFCDGQLLPIAQNTALFSLLGKYRSKKSNYNMQTPLLLQQFFLSNFSFSFSPQEQLTAGK